MRPDTIIAVRGTVSWCMWGGGFAFFLPLLQELFLDCNASGIYHELSKLESCGFLLRVSRAEAVVDRIPQLRLIFLSGP